MIKDRTYYSSGAPWESKFGYTRAVQVGNLVEVSGTTSVENGQVVHAKDAYAQTKRIFQIAEEALKHFNIDLNHVIRTRIYMTNMDDFDHIARAHGEVFKEIRPASTAIEVSRFVDPEMLVEIEFTAVIS